MKNTYSIEVKKILKEAESEMYELNHPYVGSEHMILGILKISTSLKTQLNKYGLTYETFKKELIKIVGYSHKKSEYALYTPLLKRIISDATIDAEENNDGLVEPHHLLISMLEESEGVGIRILMNMNIDIENLYSDLIKISHKKESKNKSILYEIGKEIIPAMEENIYKREEELNNIMEILLRKNKNNPLLIGPAGVGKTALVEELARRIKKNLVPDALINNKIISIDTGSMISGTRYRGEFEDRLNKIIKSAIDEKNIILFIDEIHTIVNCGGAEGAVDAANILKPYLARGELKIIGATTNTEYTNTIYKDKALDRRFEIVKIDEPSTSDTKYILQGIKSNYEKHHNCIITDNNIDSIIKYADKYIYNKYNPDKSIDLLDQVCAHIQLNRPNKNIELENLESKKETYVRKKKYKDALELELKIKNLKENISKLQITEEDILKTVELKANIPFMRGINAKLDNLPLEAKKSLYGQDKAVIDCTESLKNKYLSDSNKPLSILINGPSGVGKTYLTKVISSYLFGNSVLKIDSIELSNETSINKLIGSNKGYIGYDEEPLLNIVNDNPYLCIIIDEIENVSPKIQKLLGEILENGTIRNSKGEILHFEYTTFLMTSNIKLTTNLGFNNTSTKKISYLNENLTNRIDRVVTLKSLSEPTIRKYIKKNSNLSKKESDELIKNSDIKNCGLHNICKQLEKYKRTFELTKV